MSKKHYYRLPADSEVGEKLTELYDRGADAMNAASGLAKELKADEFTPSQGFALGGIGCLLFRSKPSEKIYDVIDRSCKLYACTPNTSTKEGVEVLKRISGLPGVRIEEVCEVFGIDFRNKNFRGRSMPNFFRVEETWDYVRTEYPLYIEGMNPITKEEFERACRYVNGENE